MIAVIECLNFGLLHLALAAEARDQELLLLTDDASRYWYELERCGSRVTVDEVDTSDVGAIVDRLSGEGNLDGIVRMTDLWSIQAIDAAKRLSLPHTNRQSVRLIRNKAEMRNRLSDAGLSSGRSIVFDPRETNVDDALTEVTFPCIIKDISGSSSQNVWAAYDSSQFLDAIEESRAVPYIRGECLTIEPYFPGTLYSVETLSWQGETTVLGVSGRVMSSEPTFREEAFSFPVQFLDEEMHGLKSWISSVLRAMEYDSGFSHTEFMLTKDGFEVIEINPRLGGVLIGESINRCYGINVHSAFIDMALGVRPAVLDVNIEAQKGVAQKIVYAERAGVFHGMLGADTALVEHAECEVFPLMRDGFQVASCADQRGAAAIVLAEGCNSELALLNVLSASRSISTDVRSE